MRTRSTPAWRMRWLAFTRFERPSSTYSYWRRMIAPSHRIGSVQVTFYVRSAGGLWSTPLTGTAS
eukprot:21123-Eustigmatos_ZCMA.PRE.1